MKKKRKAELLEVVPGLSLGPVKIGAPKSELLDLGFTEDPERTGGQFYRKGDLLVGLKDDAVSQIWHEFIDRSKLRFKGKKFPKGKTLAEMRKFFSDCEKDVRGSGGMLMFCESRGVQLVTSFMREDRISFSVTTPQNVAEMIGPRPKNEP